MGYTSYEKSNSPKNYAEEKAEICKIYADGGRNEILQASKVGGTWYLAVKTLETGVVWAGVCLVNYRGGWFTYKDMAEHMLPYYFEAPASLLKKLSPSDDESTNQWRESCQTRINSKKEKSENLTKLENGMLFDTKGMFGKCQGKDIETLLAHDVTRRKFWWPAGGVMFTVRKTQMKEIASRKQLATQED